MREYFANIFSGFSRLFDLSGTVRDPAVDAILDQSDAEAVAGDWQAVGDDLREAIIQYRRLNRIDSKDADSLGVSCS